jgi:hypothetical protein
MMDITVSGNVFAFCETRRSRTRRYFRQLQAAMAASPFQFNSRIRSNALGWPQIAKVPAGFREVGDPDKIRIARQRNNAMIPLP